MWKLPSLLVLLSLYCQYATALSVLPSTGCGPVCKIFCLFGNVLDARGCPTCQCKPAPATFPATGGQRYPAYCGPVCRIFCPYGNVLDSRGCPLCRCKPAPSNPPRPQCGPVCAIFCPHGNVIDARGCPTCRCRPGPQPLPDFNRCPQIQCPICPRGFKYTTDEKGCNFCSCKDDLLGAPTPPPDFNRCPQIQCPICPGGFKYTTDEKGCNFCSCKDPLIAPVPPPNQAPQCGPVCLIFCPYGNVLDARGCPTCNCRPRPPPRCLQPRETGPCRAAFPSFYYDTQNNRCQRFIYGGCRGNQNRFNSLRECQAVCESNQNTGNNRDLCPDIRSTCRRNCWLGFEKDNNGCEICQCRNVFSGF